mmetsp:Transcript_598/g.1364  ORF Transcript_598/g.1364 Transcript_598/m.1364 type:complete len:139 (-) Transcript_598:4018-4434(-)
MCLQHVHRRHGNSLQGSSSRCQTAKLWCRCIMPWGSTVRSYTHTHSSSDAALWQDEVVHTHIPTHTHTHAHDRQHEALNIDHTPHSPAMYTCSEAPPPYPRSHTAGAPSSLPQQLPVNVPEASSTKHPMKLMVIIHNT